MFHTHNLKNEKYKYGIVGTAPLSVGVKWIITIVKKIKNSQHYF